MIPAEEELIIFAGAATKPALEDAINIFSVENNISVTAIYGGSGIILSQLKLSGKGDLFIPGSPDYIEKAIEQNLIEENSIKPIAYLIPAIITHKANPKNIRNLQDLKRKNIRLGICLPEKCVLGDYAREIFEYNNLTPEIYGNIITYTDNAAKTLSLILLNQTDAVIGWRFFQNICHDECIAINLMSNELPRISYIPAAIVKNSRKKNIAKRFIDFLMSEKGRSIFQQHGYTVNRENPNIEGFK